MRRKTEIVLSNCIRKSLYELNASSKRSNLIFFLVYYKLKLKSFMLRDIACIFTIIKLTIIRKSKIVRAIINTLHLHVENITSTDTYKKLNKATTFYFYGWLFLRYLPALLRIYYYPQSLFEKLLLS